MWPLPQQLKQVMSLSRHSQAKLPILPHLAHRDGVASAVGAPPPPPPPLPAG